MVKILKKLGRVKKAFSMIQSIKKKKNLVSSSMMEPESFPPKIRKNTRKATFTAAI